MTWDGTVSGNVDSYGKIAGTVTGTAKTTETYFEKGRPAGELHMDIHRAVLERPSP